MSFGSLAPYLRSRFGKEERFATGSLLFDLERAAHRDKATPLGIQRSSRKGHPAE